MQQALLVIDIQNDYFPGGAFPLWDAEGVLGRTVQAIGQAQSRGMPVILVQHVAAGPAPFFVPGTPGVELHPRLRAAAPAAPVVIKHFADSFHQTELEAVLRSLEVTDLLVCGMMTQNCVTHTAISKAAEAYRVSVVADCSTTVSEILHRIALNALTTRVAVADWPAVAGS